MTNRIGHTGETTEHSKLGKFYINSGNPDGVRY